MQKESKNKTSLNRYSFSTFKMLLLIISISVDSTRYRFTNRHIHERHTIISHCFSIHDIQLFSFKLYAKLVERPKS